MRFFKRVWRKIKPSKRYENYGTYGRDGVFTPHWGFIVPHTERRGGAARPRHNADGSENADRMDEYHYGIMEVPIDMQMETRDVGGVYGAASRLARKGCNASIEPHKNAYNGKVDYVLMLVLEGDELSEKYAMNIGMSMANVFRKKFAGVKKVKRGDRGAANLIAAADAGMEVRILSEGFFIDNPHAWVHYEDMKNFWAKELM